MDEDNFSRWFSNHTKTCSHAQSQLDEYNTYKQKLNDLIKQKNIRISFINNTVAKSKKKTCIFYILEQKYGRKNRNGY